MLKHGDNIYEILGIDRDADTRTIKKAYAKLVKQYHPEENPEEWKRIHDAYELAVRLASDRAKRARMGSESWKYGSTEQELLRDLAASTDISVPGLQPQPRLHSPSRIHTLSAEQENELEDVFGDLEQVVSEQQEEEKKAKREKWEDVGKAIQHVKRLFAQKNFDLKEWEALFGTDDIQKKERLPVFSQSKFLQALGDCFTLNKIDDDLYDLLSDELNRISNYMERTMIHQDGMDMASLSYAKTSIDMAYRETVSPKALKRLVYAGIAVFLSVALVLSLLYVNSGTYQDWSNSRESSGQILQESEEMSLEERPREEISEETETPQTVLIRVQGEAESTYEKKIPVDKIDTERKYESDRAFPYEAMEPVSDALYAEIKKAYEAVEFKYEFQKGDVNSYGFYIEKYIQLLHKERTFWDAVTGREYYIDEVGGDSGDIESYKYYLFDMSGDGYPELWVMKTNDNCDYCFQYDSDTDEIVIWDAEELNYVDIMGSQELYQLPNLATHLYYFFWKLNEKGEIETRIHYMEVPYDLDENDEFIVAFLVTMPYYPIDQERNIYTQEMLKQGYYDEEGDYLYFCLTEEQYNELISPFDKGIEGRCAKLEVVTFTYEELLAYEAND